MGQQIHLSKVAASKHARYSVGCPLRGPVTETEVTSRSAQGAAVSRLPTRG